MPMIEKTEFGMVVAIWGQAWIRDAHGQFRPLKVGDAVRKGAVVLTQQDSIVQLEQTDAPPERQAAAKTTQPTDADSVIESLNRGDARTAPAAGLAGGDSGDLTPGYRVERIVELTTPGGTLRSSGLDTAVNEPPLFSGNARTVSAEQLPALLVEATEEGPNVGIGVSAPAGATQVRIDAVPTVGQVLLADGTPVSAGSVLAPAQLNGLVYVPPADYLPGTPTGELRFTASTGSVATIGRVDFVVTPVNDAPLANAGAVNAAEDTLIPVSLTGSDVDGTVASVVIDRLPTIGTLLLADGVTPVLLGQTLTAAQAGSLVLRPLANQFGDDSIAFTVVDDAGASSTSGNWSVRIRPVDDMPVARPDSFTVAEDGSATINVRFNDGDVETPVLTITHVNGNAVTDGGPAVVVTHGTVQLVAGQLLFTPAANYSGAANFNYTITDGAHTAVAAVNGTVTAVDDLPIANADSFVVAEDGSVTINVVGNDIDIDGDTLTITHVNGTPITDGGPAVAIPDGSVRLVSGQLVFTPAPDYNGPASFGYTVSDGTTSVPAMATGTVTPVSDAPQVGVPPAQSVNEDTALVFSSANGNALGVADADGGTVTVTVGVTQGTFTLGSLAGVTVSGNGSASVTLSGSPAAVNAALQGASYRPSADYNGAASLTLSANDGTSASAGSVAIGVVPVADIVADTIATAEDTAVAINVLSNDTFEGGGPAVVAVNGLAISAGGAAVAVANGSVALNALGQLVFTPAANYNGPAGFSYTVSSGGTRETASVTVNVTPVADAATVTLSASASVAEGGTIVYTATLDTPALAPVTVDLSNGASLTIAAGASSGSVAVAAPGDDVYVDAGSVSATISGASGGGFDVLNVSAAPATTAVTDTVNNTTVSLTASPSVAEGGLVTYTASLTAPAQSAVTVNLSNGATITIAAGASSGSVNVPAPADDVVVDTGTVSATIASASGGNFENLVVNPAPAVTTVSDTLDTTTVSLGATPSVAEGGTIVYTASLTAPAQTAVTVTLSNGATIAIAAGASSGSVSVAAPSDDVHVDAGSVSATISSAVGGNFEALAIDPTAASTAVTDTLDSTTVALSASPVVAEGGAITYTASLNAVAQTPVTVTLSNGATIVIAAGSSSGTVSVAAPSDDVYADAGSVSATISAASGGNFESLVVDATPAVSAITDTIATTTVSLTASPGITEGGTIVYTASLTAPAQSAVTVTLDNGATITIAAGSSSGSVGMAAPSDDVYVDSGSVTARISSAAGGNFESLVVDATPAVTSVTDTIDTTTVSLTGSPSVAEGGSIVYVASLTAPAQSTVTVTLSNGATITIAAGSSSGSVSVPAPTDDVFVDAGSVTASIASASGGGFENLAANNAPVTTAITDTVDTATVSLTASASTAEGGSIVYTASLTAPAQSAVLVTLSDGSTLTIAAGSSSGSVSVPAPANDVYAGGGSVSLQIGTASGGNFENLVVDATPAVTAVVDTIDTTTVSLTASPSVAEGGSIVYTASLTAVAQTAVTVTLDDGTTITIGAGSSSGSISVAAPSDDVYVDGSTITRQISSAAGGNFENLAVNPAPASTSVTDTIHTTTVTLTGSPSVTEGGSIVYVASLTAPAQTPVTVTLTDGSTITIAAGSSSGAIAVPAPADDVYVDAGSLSVGISTASGGGFENLAVDPALVTTAITDTIDTTTLTLTASPSVAEGGTITYTASLTSTAQSAVTVTLDNGDTITIAAGASSGSLNIAAPGDDVYIDGSTITRQITGASGGNFENLVADTTPVSTTVTDTADTTTVSLSATPSVAEGGTITYTASLTAVAQTAVTVTLDDGTTITIAAGSSAGSVSVAAPADDPVIDASTVTRQISNASGGNFENLVVNPAPVNTAVTDTTDTTTVTLTATPTVAEGGTITYTASLTAAAQSDVTVTLDDGTVITIPAGASAASLNVAAPSDDVYVDASTVTRSIAGASGGNFENLVANPAPAVTSVSDTVNTTVVSLTATPSVAEGGTVTYTASLTAVAQSAVSVTLDNGHTIVIAAGTSAGSVSIAAPADDVYVDAASIATRISSATGGGFENLAVNPAPAVTAITDTLNTTTVTLTATPSVAEGGTITYTASLTAMAQTPVTVTLSNGATITIAAGASSGSINVAAPGEDTIIDAGSVSATISTASGGNFENLAIDPAAATTSVSDTIDTTTVSLSAPASVAEGGSITYTASLTSAAATPVSVTLSNGATITIAAGASSGSVSVPAPSDDVIVDAGSVSATIASATGGGFENLVVNGAAATTGIADTLDTTTVSLTATPSVAEGGTIIYTAALTSAAQTPVTVTLSNGATITIAAGASSGSVNVAAPAEDAHVDAGNVSATITSAAGGNFENLVVDPAPAVTSVSDTLSTTTLSLTASASVAEGGSITYTAALTSAAQTPVTVTLSNGATITIAAGASSGSTSVAAPSDDVYVDAGNVSATIATATGGNFENLVVDPAAATTAISDTIDVATVSLAGSASVGEGASASYSVSLTAPAATAVTVTLAYSGSAADGTDFTGVATVTIPAGASSASFDIPTLNDHLAEGNETVVVQLVSASGGNFESLQLAGASSVTTTIVDDDSAALSLSATPSLTEAGGTIVYTASITQPPVSALQVTLSNGAIITIAAGATSATVSVPVAASDDVYVDPGSVGASIAGTSGGGIGLLVDTTPAVTTITDTVDTTTVSLSATPSVAEGGTIVYTATLTSAAQSAVTVTISGGATITIAAGATSGTVNVPAPADDPHVDAGSVSRSIVSATGGNFENLVIDPAVATTAVSDTVDTTMVSLGASASVAEGGSITYTASLTSAAQSAVTVTLSNGATITIAAGASSGSVSVAAPSDDVYSDTGSVSATISSASGGNFENLSVDPAAATTTITDTLDTTTVSLTATPTVAEGGNITYTASLTSAAQTPVTVTLSNGASITIAAGASSGTVSVPAPGDDVYSDAGNVSATISSATGGNFESLVVNPAAAITSVSDTVNDTTVSLAATPSVAEGGSITYTASLTSAAQTALTVTLSNGATITIAAGASSGSVSVAAPSDDVYSDAGTVSATITSAAGGNFENLVVDGTAAVTSVTDTVDTTTVSLTGAGSLVEGASGSYTVSLTSPAQADVTINLAYSGTAANGADFSGIATVTVPAGASSATFSIVSIDDVLAEGAESFTVSLASATGGNFESLVLSGSANSVTTTITDEAVPDQVLVTLSGPTAVTEGLATTNYTLALSEPAVSAVTVNLTYSGTASDGSDYTRVVSVLIPAGASSTTFNLATLDDVLADSGETIVVGIGAISGGGFESIAADPAGNSVTTTIADEAPADVTTVSLSAPATVAEGGSIVYTATLTSAAQSPVTVTITGGATITIAAGATSGTVSVAAPGDDPYLDAGSVSRSIVSATGGNFEDLAIDAVAATTTVTDTVDTTTVSLTASGSVAEGGNIVYTASLTSPAQGAVTVNLSNGATITIAAGASSGSVSVAAPSDDVYSDAGSVSATISSATGGNFESLVIDPAAATTAITDTIDNATVTLTATPSVAEGGTITYTASLTSTAQSAVTVNLSNGATITIAAGASSGTVNVAAPGEDVYVDAGSVSATISSASGGGFENLVVDPAAATTTVTDTTNATTVSLSASASVAEGGNITYTATLTSAAQSPVIVNLSNGATITIAAGASSASVSVPAPSDDVVVDAGSVSATISSATGGNFESLQVNPAAATTAITDTIHTTTVSLTASGTVAEGGSIVYTASLTSAAQSPVTVTLSNGATIIIASGASSGTVSVAAPTDDVYVDGGSVSATISSASGGNFESLAIDPAAATTAITDTTDTTTLSLTATGTVAEGGTITYTASLTSVAQSPVTVTLSNGATITIAAGASSGSVDVAAPGDDVYVDAGSVSATITDASGGNFENLTINPAAATTGITDTTDAATVSLSATPSVAEGGSIVYTATLTHAAQSAVTVTISGGLTIAIAAGATTGTLTVPAPGDDPYADAGTVSRSITAATGGNFEALTIDGNATTTTVSDTIATTTLSLTATASVAEGGSIVYTASLTNPAQSAVTVTLSNGATINIAAGASSGTVSVAAPTDDVYVDAGSVSATISSASGGNFEDLSISATPATTTITDTIATTTVSLTATASVAEGGNIVYTAALNNPAQTPVTVTLSNGAMITIAAGASSGTASVPAPGDDAYVDAGNVSTTISSATGGNFENLVIDPAAATTAITDTIDTTTVSLTATPSVAEGGSIVYTASLTNPAQSAVTVTLSNGATINIAAGASSGSVSVAAPAEDVYLDAGSVSATISSATGGNFENLTINGAAATTTVTDTIDTATLSLTGAATVTEGASASYTVSLTSPAQSAVTVNLAYSGTAANGTDYSGVASVTIPAGASSATFDIATLDDALADSGETFTVSVASASGGNFENLAISGSAGSVTTTVNDEAVADTVLVSLSGPAAVTEGAATGSFTVTLGQAALSAVSVNLTYAGTASNGSDYTGVVSVIIPAGATSATFSLATLDDALADSGETIVVGLGAISGGGFEAIAAHPTNNAVTTTINDEAAPDTVLVSLSGPSSVTEGATTTNYTVSLGQAALTPVTVNLNYGGTASAGGTDYTSVVSVTIPAGATSVTFALPTTNDVVDESNETIVVSLGSISGGGFEAIAAHGTNNTVTTTITDDDTMPSLAIGDVSVNEAAGTMTFTVTLSAASGQTVSVSYGTSNGTASAGSDYTAVSGSLSFAPGVTSQTITVPIGDDSIDEPNETYYVNLSAPTNAIIADALGVGTIVDNDATPTVVSVSAASATEGGNLVHTVTLSNASSTTITLPYTLTGGSATAGIDFTATPTFSNGVTLAGGVLTVPAGVSSFTVTVASINDTIDEPAESYSLTVGGVGGTGTINDDDAAPTLSVGNITVNETAGYAVFSVALSNPSSSAVGVNLSFANGTATGGTGTGTGSSTDYGNNTRMQVSTDGGATWSALGTNTATIAAGQTSVLVRTYVNNNTGGTELATETFTLTASVSSGTTSNANATGTATILEQNISISNDTETEGTGAGTTTGTFTVTISPAFGADTIVPFTLGGSALSPADYGSLTFSNGVTAGAGTLSIPAGVTSFTISVPVVRDALDEANETVTVNIAGSTGTLTINDDDATPSLAINDVTVNEAAGTATFTVTLSAASGQTVTVGYTMTGQTALPGSDYTAGAGTLTFAPGTTTQTITVPILQDNLFEGAETFRINLSTPTNATISDAVGIGTIRDDGTGSGGTDNDTPTLAVSSLTVSDQSAGFAVFVVSLSNPSASATGVSLALTGGTATGGGTDFGAAGATNLQVSTDNGATWSNTTSATIAPNDTYVLVRTPITADLLNEVSETFTLTATRTTGTTLNASASGLATITDANNAPDAVADVPASNLQEDTANTVLAGQAILGGSGNNADSDPNAETLAITGAVAGNGAVTGAVALAAPLSVSGLYGTLLIQADGTYTYTLDNSRIQTQNLIGGQSYVDLFTYRITDGNGGYDTATISVSVTGSIDLTAITPVPVAITADGLQGEYYGYNDSVVAGNRVHADDGSATSLGTGANLESVEDVELIINGRNAAMGGPANIVGTANAGAPNAADVLFNVRTLNYGTTPVVSSNLGDNGAVAAGNPLPPQDNISGSGTSTALANFLDQDSSTAVVQTGTPTGATVGTQTGLGATTDAIIRMSGYAYLERGNYDFRVTADDGFRLKVGGETLLEFDGNQPPTTRTYYNVEVSDLISGLTSIELLYWEQGGNANLQFEFKLSDSDTWVPFSLDSIAFFSAANVPTLTDTRIQDVVESSTNQQYLLRTGSVLDGDSAGNTLTGNAGRDYIQGFGGNDVLNGFGAADFLDGGDGNDTLDGGEGNDILIGGSGNDSMTGGAGDDIYRIDSAGDVVVELAGAGQGTDTVEIEANYAVGTYTAQANIENVLLHGSLNSNVTGNTADNRITGNDGNNVLIGGAGDDRILGGRGNDTLSGDAGPLAGGGAGKDIFEWNLADRGTPGSPAVDTITDFTYSGSTTSSVVPSGDLTSQHTDVLDLRDLLQGEHSSSVVIGGVPVEGNLQNYIDVSVSGGNTTLRISSTGGFTGGTYAAGAEDQRIVLSGVDLFAATGVSVGNEAELLRRMLANGTLVVD